MEDLQPKNIEKYYKNVVKVEFDYDNERGFLFTSLIIHTHS